MSAAALALPQDLDVDLDDFAPRLSYSLSCHRDLFEEVAKYRAARRMFAKIVKERFNAQNPKSCLFRTYSGSCGSTLTPQQPQNALPGDEVPVPLVLYQ